MEPETEPKPLPTAEEILGKHQENDLSEEEEEKGPRERAGTPRRTAILASGKCCVLMIGVRNRRPAL